MKREILLRSTLFLATLASVSLWIPLILLLDVSSGTDGSKYGYAWTFPLVLGTVFLMIDLLVNWNSDKLLANLGIRTGIVSILGSLFFLALLWLSALWLGFLNTRFVGVDIFATVLFALTFISIHFTLSYLLRKGVVALFGLNDVKSILGGHSPTKI